MADRTPIVYGDGEQTRDFIYVADVVRANLLAVEKPAAPGHVFETGSGTRISLNTLLEILSALLGVPTRVEYRPERPGDIRHSVADISKAQRLLDFTPTIPLEEGLRRTIAAWPPIEPSHTEMIDATIDRITRLDSPTIVHPSNRHTSQSSTPNANPLLKTIPPHRSCSHSTDRE